MNLKKYNFKRCEDFETVAKEPVRECIKIYVTELAKIDIIKSIKMRP